MYKINMFKIIITSNISISCHLINDIPKRSFYPGLYAIIRVRFVILLFEILYLFQIGSTTSNVCDDGLKMQIFLSAFCL